MNESSENSPSHVYDRALFLHGSKRNEVLTLAEIEQYGIDSFGDANYVSIYGMTPREWYSQGIRVLGRTAVECTRDDLASRIARDIVALAARMPSKQFVVVDPFAGSCNILFWILRHLANSEALAMESDPQVFELTYRNLMVVHQRIEIVRGDCETLLHQLQPPEDQGVVAFIAPPWGTALDEVEGLDLRRTIPPVTQVIEQIMRQLPNHKVLFATQVYEKVDPASLAQIQSQLEWTELRVYEINEAGRNHGILLGTKGWIP